MSERHSIGPVPKGRLFPVPNGAGLNTIELIKPDREPTNLTVGELSRALNRVPAFLGSRVQQGVCMRAFDYNRLMLYGHWTRPSQAFFGRDYYEIDYSARLSSRWQSEYQPDTMSLLDGSVISENGSVNTLNPLSGKLPVKISGLGLFEPISGDQPEKPYTRTIALLAMARTQFTSQTPSPLNTIDRNVARALDSALSVFPDRSTLNTDGRSTIRELLGNAGKYAECMQYSDPRLPLAQRTVETKPPQFYLLATSISLLAHSVQRLSTAFRSNDFESSEEWRAQTRHDVAIAELINSELRSFLRLNFRRGSQPSNTTTRTINTRHPEDIDFYNNSGTDELIVNINTSLMDIRAISEMVRQRIRLIRQNLGSEGIASSGIDTTDIRNRLENAFAGLECSTCPLSQFVDPELNAPCPFSRTPRVYIDRDRIRRARIESGKFSMAQIIDMLEEKISERIFNLMSDKTVRNTVFIPEVYNVVDPDNPDHYMSTPDIDGDDAIIIWGATGKHDMERLQPCDPTDQEAIDTINRYIRLVFPNLQGALEATSIRQLTKQKSVMSDRELQSAAFDLLIFICEGRVESTKYETKVITSPTSRSVVESQLSKEATNYQSVAFNALFQAERRYLREMIQSNQADNARNRLQEWESYLDIHYPIESTPALQDRCDRVEERLFEMYCRKAKSVGVIAEIPLINPDKSFNSEVMARLVDIMPTWTVTDISQQTVEETLDEIVTIGTMDISHDFDSHRRALARLK